MKKTDNDADIIQLSDKRQPSPSHMTSGEIIIGTVTGLDKQGLPLVDFPENTAGQALVAIATLAMNQQHIGRKVALLFTKGDTQSPVIMGLIHSPLQDMLEDFDPSQADSAVNIEATFDSDDVAVDGKRIFEAKEEIVFKCGESSITLTKSGKIVIRGKYLINHSTGINWIMGGDIQVN